MAVKRDISEEISTWRSSAYGQEVRNATVSALSKLKEQADSTIDTENANKAELLATILAEKAAISEAISAEAIARQSQDAVLNARMDTFTRLPSGSTSGDAELTDIRVGADGVTYQSAGGAVRGQVNQLSESIKKICGADVTWQENYYVRSNNGAIVAYAEQVDVKYWASNEVEVKENEKVVFTFYGGSNIVGCAFYNSKHVYISGFGSATKGDIISLDVPTNAKYFRYTKETKGSGKNDSPLYVIANRGLTDIVNTLDDITVKMMDDHVSAITDMNNIASGTIYKFLSAKSELQLAHAPLYPYKGLVVTLNATRSVENVKMQIATTDVGRIFIRSMWTTWGEWKEIGKETSGQHNGNILAMYDNMRFIGDSLTWSQVYQRITPKETRQAYRPYPKIVAELCNSEYEILASPGDTSIVAWSRWENRIIEKDNNINIIYLGTNAGLTDTIETDCPVNGSVEDYANTNTGCYGKFLKKISDLGQKAILIKIYDGSGDVAITNSVIEKFATRFNFPYVDAIDLPTVYRLCTIERDRTGGVHYNDIGYSVFANRFIGEVNNLSESMLSRLIPNQ